MKQLLLALATLAFAACAPKAPAERASAAPEATPAKPAATSDALTPQGWGAIRIGMTKAELTAAAGDNSVAGGVGGPEPDQCDEYHPARAPEGMYVMLEQNKVSRITLTDSSTVKTDKGLGIGDTAAAIKAALGAEAKVLPHKYQEPPAEYVMTWSGQPGDPNGRGYSYEVGSDGKVQAIHAGGPAIGYVEGCL